MDAIPCTSQARHVAHEMAPFRYLVLSLLHHHVKVFHCALIRCALIHCSLIHCALIHCSLIHCSLIHFALIYWYSVYSLVWSVQVYIFVLQSGCSKEFGKKANFILAIGLQLNDMCMCLTAIRTRC